MNKKDVKEVAFIMDILVVIGVIILVFIGALLKTFKDYNRRK